MTTWMTTCPICRDVRSFAIDKAVAVQAGMRAEAEAGESARTQEWASTHAVPRRGTTSEG